MTPDTALSELHSAMQRVNDAGWMIVGRLELTKPKVRKVEFLNAIDPRHGMIGDGESAIEEASIVACVKRVEVMQLAEATTIVQAFAPDAKPRGKYARHAAVHGCGGLEHARRATTADRRRAAGECESSQGGARHGLARPVSARRG